MQLTALIGKKIYQKQGFLQDGTRVPLTGVGVGGNFVSQIKTLEKEGYNALQIGIGTKTKANKTLLGHLKKAGIKNNSRFFKELKVDNTEGANLGAELNVLEVFAPGDTIDVTGTSKGKGWAGGVKRWGFRGGPRTHGQSDRERAPGSIGQTTTPGRVYKGKKMAGRMGQDTVTVKNLEIIEITNDGVLLIKGLVPGSLNSILTVKKVGENKKFVPLYKEESENVQEQEAVSQENAEIQTHSSDDAQKNQEETQAPDTSSLNGSQSVESEVEAESSEGSVSDSPQNGSESSIQESKDKKEKKEEVSKDAKS